MVCEARLRSQRPMSHSPFMPRSRSCVEFFVGNLIEALDWPTVLAGELMQPDVGALGDEHDVGHPLDVGAEAFVLDVGASEGGHVGMATHLELVPLLAALARATAVRMEAHPDRGVFFFEHIDGEQQAAKICAEDLAHFSRRKASWPLSESGAASSGALSRSSRLTLGLAGSSSSSWIFGRLAK